MDEFVRQLKIVGLGDYEAMIYATLVRFSPSSAAFIAKKCNLSRSSVYTTLNSLIGKGLVGVSYKNEVKQFIAEDYEVVESLLLKEQKTLRRKFETLDSLRDNYMFFRKVGAKMPDVVFFEGVEGLKKIYLSMLREARPKEVLYLMRSEWIFGSTWSFVFGEEWHARVRKLRQEKNIRQRLLINPTMTERTRSGPLYNSRHGLEYRFLPTAEAINDFAIYILGDTVAIMSMEENNPIGIKMTNHNFADNYSNIFNALWHISGK